MSSGDDYYDTVELQPFVHQVGGHNIVLQINKSTICKPYLDREVNFYSNIPDEFREFTPPFKGIIYVRFHHNNGQFVFHGHIPNNAINTGDRNSINNALHSTETCNVHNLAVKDSSGSQQKKEWSYKCIERHIKSWSDNPVQKFIILGNLLESYRRPCTMDLKMGTRQHADIATEEKRKLLEERCANSTSSHLGFRINGSQVYKATSSSYISRDKYFGRRLDVVGVNEELHSFFHDGHRLRSDVIKIIVHKLKSLYHVLSNQKTFCFFSCSLLLLYDSDDSSQNYPESSENDSEHSERPLGSDLRGNESNGDFLRHSCCKADVKLIDFAHTLLRSDVGDSAEGCGVGLLEGLQNLIKILELLPT